MFWKFLRRAAAVLVGIVLLAVVWDVATYDRAAWQADYARIKSDMANGYANLDWMVERRHLDLRQLDARTGSAIDNAHSRVRAFFALRNFVHSFNDPHLRLEDSSGEPSNGLAPPPSAAAATAPPDRPAGASCAEAGYEEGDHAFAFPFERLPGWRPLGGTDFPIGISGRTGVIRIAQFGEDQYLSACERLFAPGIGRRTLQLRVRSALQGELRTAIAGLRRAGATRLLVDLSGNGGGTEWVNEALALFTNRSMQRQAPRRIAPACDRRSVWQTGRAPCPIFGAPEEAAQIAGTGEWSGPLLVLMDGGTGSASEDFVAWIADNGAGRLLGARTAGAGCGYVNGGTRTRLNVLPVDLRMPNCARFLRNGINEIEGIQPNVPLPMDRPQEAAAALARALGG